MRIRVCGIACERCPRMMRGICPSGEAGCKPKENRFCKIATCTYNKGVNLCFECTEFPCETTRLGHISYDYCQYISGREEV